MLVRKCVSVTKCASRPIHVLSHASAPVRRSGHPSWALREPVPVVKVCMTAHTPRGCHESGQEEGRGWGSIFRNQEIYSEGNHLFCLFFFSFFILPFGSIPQCQQITQSKPFFTPSHKQSKNIYIHIIHLSIQFKGTETRKNNEKKTKDSTSRIHHEKQSFPSVQEVKSWNAVAGTTGAGEALFAQIRNFAK